MFKEMGQIMGHDEESAQASGSHAGDAAEARADLVEGKAGRRDGRVAVNGRMEVTGAIFPRKRYA